MKLWARIKRLSFKGLLQFGWLFITHPFFVVPTLKATKRTFIISNAIYGSEHHKSNKGNAFRHALWNILICQYTQKWMKNHEKSVDFTKKLTVLYENATKNDLLDEAMDLQNNEIGRALFLKHFDKKEREIVQLTQKMSENAQKVRRIEEIELYKNQLVYITESYV